MVFVIGCGRAYFLQVVFAQSTCSATFHLLEVVFTAHVAHENQAFDRLYVRARCNHIDSNGNTRVIIVAERT